MLLPEAHRPTDLLAITHAEIVHHEDLPRLRQLHDTIVSTRQQVAGCTDPDATNFNPVANVRLFCYAHCMHVTGYNLQGTWRLRTYIDPKGDRCNSLS